jgi:ribosome-associated heat shock protein Hsp15
MTDTIRLDKWLWYSRLFKSRSLAAKHCQGGKIRINRQVTRKASAPVHVGDVLTFPQRDRIRVIEILELGTRRGPAAEARLLYNDLSPEPPAKAGGAPGPAGPVRERGTGRPTKADRRALDRLRNLD